VGPFVYLVRLRCRSDCSSERPPAIDDCGNRAENPWRGILSEIAIFRQPSPNDDRLHLTAGPARRPPRFRFQRKTVPRSRPNSIPITKDAHSKMSIAVISHTDLNADFRRTAAPSREEAAALKLFQFGGLSLQKCESVQTFSAKQTPRTDLKSRGVC